MWQILTKGAKYLFITISEKFSKINYNSASPLPTMSVSTQHYSVFLLKMTPQKGVHSLVLKTL